MFLELVSQVVMFQIEMFTICKQIDSVNEFFLLHI